MAEMQKYIAEVKQFFSLIKQNMVDASKKPNMSAASLARIQDAQRAVADMERKIIENPFGIIWIDLAFTFLDSTKNCHPQVSNNIIHLFHWAIKKSPVNPVRDVATIGLELKMLPVAMFGNFIDPNTLTLSKPLKVFAKQCKIVEEQKKVDFVHKR